MSSTLLAHLAGGHTTVCRCWKIERLDGTVMGFTDHDGPLSFEGVSFAPEAGLTASAIAQSTGLSIDNSEAIGALNSDAIAEEDLLAGRYDGAEVTAYLVNWNAPTERMIQMRGSIGQVTRSAGAFVAEIRGLAERLNNPQGRAYQRQCSALLGDDACGADLSLSGRRAEATLISHDDARVLRFASLPEVPEGALSRGRLTVLDGDAAGLTGVIKTDQPVGALREIALWQSLEANIQPGDRLRVEIGCDKTPETCKARFANFANFQGFPHIPGEDWLMSYPTRGGVHDGGSLTGSGS